MATGRLVFWPITNGHTAGLNRASFRLGHFSWRLSHSVTSQDPKQSHRHRWGCCLKSTKTNNPQMSKVVCVFVHVCAAHMNQKPPFLCVFVCHAAMLKQLWAVSRWFSLCVCIYHAGVVTDRCIAFFFSPLTDIFTISWHFREHTSRPVFMLQSSCFVWVTRQKHTDILIQITKHNWAKELKFGPGEGRKCMWKSRPNLIGWSRLELL